MTRGRIPDGRAGYTFILSQPLHHPQQDLGTGTTYYSISPDGRAGYPSSIPVPPRSAILNKTSAQVGVSIALALTVGQGRLRSSYPSPSAVLNKTSAQVPVTIALALTARQATPLLSHPTAILNKTSAQVPLTIALPLTAGQATLLLSQPLRHPQEDLGTGTRYYSISPDGKASYPPPIPAAPPSSRRPRRRYHLL